jgi:hypothetical protein
MSFFECSRCHCVEDTALCRYWLNRLHQTPVLCSACDPKIARWHDQFQRESAEHWVSDNRGFVFSRKEVEDWLGQPV